jgi:hypothetical protein
MDDINLRVQVMLVVVGLRCGPDFCCCNLRAHCLGGMISLYTHTALALLNLLIESSLHFKHIPAAL